MTTPPAAPPEPRTAIGVWLARGATLGFCLVHAAIVWAGMGGWDGLNSPWPPLRADHGIHYHQAIVTRTFLATTGTTAGYDPSFMAGYPASIVSDLSSTLPDFVVWAFGGSRPAFAYKLYAGGSMMLLPWVVAAAAMAFGASPRAVAVAVVLFMIHFWSDAPAPTAGMGMVSYTLSAPLALLAAAAIVAYLERGGVGLWVVAAVACSGVFLVHVTAPMIVGPAGLAAYVVAIVRARRAGRPLPISRHVGFWAIGPIVLAANAFWWLPGYLLASTKGEGMMAMAHPESVLGRVADIFWDEPPSEPVLFALGIAGLIVWARRSPIATAGLGAVAAAGFAWGYLAGFFRVLDPLQPGRHTYAFFTAACLPAGVFLDEAVGRLRSGGRLDRLAVVVILVIGVRLFGPLLTSSVRELVEGEGRRPFLTSRATPQLLWIVDHVKAHMKPGERLLFEETGRSLPGQGDPFAMHHYSAVLPSTTGVEVLGGPYLHSTVTTNFTQFGEGKLFGKPEWGRDEFVRYARLYRPAAILCWSPKARVFCLGNPDLIEILADDRGLLLGRVRGFEGATIRGTADVAAGPNRIEVKNAVAGDDGLVVLRYHSVPLLESDPPVDIEPMALEDDPVPFIAFRPNGGTVVFRMKPAPWSK